MICASTAGSEGLRRETEALPSKSARKPGHARQQRGLSLRRSGREYRSTSPSIAGGGWRRLHGDLITVGIAKAVDREKRLSHVLEDWPMPARVMSSGRGRRRREFDRSVQRFASSIVVAPILATGIVRGRPRARRSDLRHGRRDAPSRTFEITASAATIDARHLRARYGRVARSVSHRGCRRAIARRSGRVTLAL